MERIYRVKVYGDVGKFRSIATCRRIRVADLVCIAVGMACQAEGLALDGLQVLATHKGVFGSVSAAKTRRVGHLLKATGEREH